MLMKSNKLLWINGIVGILGGLQIIYASSNRWHWEIIYLVPTLVENPGWGCYTDQLATFGAFYSWNVSL